jgi:hypothetical protein
MTRCVCPAPVAPYRWQPTRRGLADLGASTTATGAASGASIGGTIGSAIPLVGTAIGTILGAVGGAIAGSLYKVDPEIGNLNQAIAIWQQNPDAMYSIANKYLVLAGLFDDYINAAGIPILHRYGKMGEQKFTTDLVNLIYQAAQAGKITANDTALTVMANVVQPWIDSWGYGPMNDPRPDFINRLIIGMVYDYLVGNQTRWLARGGDYPFASLPKFKLAAAAPAATSQNAIAPVGSVSSAATTSTPSQPNTLLNADGSKVTAPGTGAVTGGGQVFWFGPQIPGDPLNGPGGYPVYSSSTGTTIIGYGVAIVLLNGGQLYLLNNSGTWFQWLTTHWTTLSSAPTQTAAAPPPTSTTIAPVGSSSGAPSSTAATLPLPPTTVLTADGSTITPTSNTALGNAQGVWYFGTATNGIFGTQLLLYANQQPMLTGGWATSALLSGGVLYQQNGQGMWFAWQNNMWVQVAGPPSSSAPATSTIQPIGTPTSVPTTIPQVTTSTPSTTVATTSTGQSVTQADLQALVAQLAAQGQTAQQAYTSALQTLQNNGVAATSQVQSAVQSAVQSTPAPATTPVAAGVSGTGWLGILAIGGTLLFATARPVGKTRKRKARA